MLPKFTLRCCWLRLPFRAPNLHLRGVLRLLLGLLPHFPKLPIAFGFWPGATLPWPGGTSTDDFDGNFVDWQLERYGVLPLTIPKYRRDVFAL